MSKMKDIRIRFSPEDLEVIDRKAEEAGISRAEFIRETMFRPIMGPDEFRRLCSDARAHIGNAIPRLHVESLVAFTLRRCLGPRKS